ncbi:MAG: hypothetical protein ACKVP5_12310 [Aestuariivirga sp.]
MLIIDTGYEDGDRFVYCPGLVLSTGQWMVDKQVKVAGHRRSE